jgi:hypothetical protein
VRSAEILLAMTLLLLTCVGPETINQDTLTLPQWWPLFAFGGVELFFGLIRRSSRQVFIAVFGAIVAIDVLIGRETTATVLVRAAMVSTLFVTSILFIGAIYRDRFASILRLIGAPMLAVATIAVCALMEREVIHLPLWFGPVFVATISLIALGYAVLTGMPLYRLSSLICAVTGTVGLTEMVVAYAIRESGWRGATSFVAGIGCLFLAAMISSWKAGWLRNVPRWFQGIWAHAIAGG